MIEDGEGETLGNEQGCQFRREKETEANFAVNSNVALCISRCPSRLSSIPSKGYSPLSLLHLAYIDRGQLQQDGMQSLHTPSRRQSYSVFQLIVLPWLSSSSPPCPPRTRATTPLVQTTRSSRRSFSSTTLRCRAAPAEASSPVDDPSSSASSVRFGRPSRNAEQLPRPGYRAEWDPRLRQYLGLGVEEGAPGHKRTAAMALARIIQGHLGSDGDGDAVYERWLAAQRPNRISPQGTGSEGDAMRNGEPGAGKKNQRVEGKEPDAKRGGEANLAEGPQMGTSIDGHGEIAQQPEVTDRGSAVSRESHMTVKPLEDPPNQSPDTPQDRAHPPEKAIKLRRKKASSDLTLKAMYSETCHTNTHISAIAPAPNQATSSASKTTFTSSHHTPQPTLPTVICHLLQSRFYRLAVHHILRTPEYGSDPWLIDIVASKMEADGAGKLAGMLRRGLKPGRRAERIMRDFELEARNSGIDGHYHEEEDLGAQVEEDLPRRPTSFWTSPMNTPVSSKAISAKTPKGRAGLHPTSPDISDKDAEVHFTSDPPAQPPSDPNAFPLSSSRLRGMTHQERLTKYYNTHLSNLVTLTSSSPAFTFPTTNPPTITLRLGNLPPPNPSLRQLRRLLDLISKLESTRGFKPDRVTANLIVNCWLRCGAGLSPRGEPEDRMRLVRTKGGDKAKDAEWKWAHKKRSDVEFGLEDVRRVFEVVRQLMERRVEELEREIQSTGSGDLSRTGVSERDHNAQPANTDSAQDSSPEPQTAGPRRTKKPVTEPGPEAAPPLASTPTLARSFSDLSYNRHVRPFALIIQKGLKRLHAKKGMEAVREWEDGMRERMEVISRIRRGGAGEYGESARGGARTEYIGEERSRNA